jgi:DNA-binding CsgD family transcriptional regulator
MKASTRNLPDTLFRHQQKLEYFSLFLLVFAVVINLDNIRTAKPWDDSYFVAMLLLVLAIFIASAWMRIQQTKARNLAREIKRNILPKGPDRDAMIAKLSTRQKEILELILLKLSNREIMEELSIEQSAFKSHVYKIYKIQNRVRRTNRPS